MCLSVTDDAGRVVHRKRAIRYIEGPSKKGEKHMNKKNLRAAGWALCLTMAVAGIGAAVGASAKGLTEVAAATQEAVYYTLTPASGSNNSYAGNCDIVINPDASDDSETPITWNLTGNSTMQPWRMGGKNLSKTDRALYSKTAMPEKITKVELSIGSASDVTVHSLKLEASTNSNFSSADTVTKTFATNSTITFTPTSGTSWAANSYYRWTLNLTIGGSNKFVGIVGAKFYYQKPIPATSVEIARGSTSSLYPAPIEDKTVALNKTAGSIAEELVATVGPSDAEDKTVTWSVGGDNPGYVNWDGATKGDTKLDFEIDLNNVGTFTITASADGGTSVTDTVTYIIVDPTAAKLVSVSYTGTPTKATQYGGNVFDPSGLTFNANYDDESSVEINASDIVWETLEAGKAPKGTYTVGKDTVDVTVNAVTVAENTLTVTVSGEATKTAYSLSEDWGHDGLVASGKYADGSNYTGTFTWSYSVANPAALGVCLDQTITVTAEAEDGTKGNKDVTVSVVGVARIGGAVDTLNRALTGVTSGSTSYVDWEDKSVNDAIYAGNSAGSNDSIQLRTDKSTSGIVTTTSGGKAYSISVVWESHTGAARSIDIYGKHTAYGAASELYGTSTQGTLLGSITKDQNSLELDGTYEYIGIRSNTGALYLTSVTIDWGYAAANTDVEAVNRFIDGKMHLENLDDESGKCKSEGWYAAAKSAFAGLSEAQKEVILASASEYKVIDAKSWKYSDIKARLSAWATANGESFDPNDGSFTKNTAKNVFFEENGKTGPIVSLAAVAGIGLIATGVLFLLRKKKEEK